MTIRFHPISSDSIRSISDWHALARPEPDAKALAVQLGCHLEEVCEMLEALTFAAGNWPPVIGIATGAHEMLSALAQHLKTQEVGVTIDDRAALLDSLADQVVTAVGVAHCAGMDLPSALAEVNRSNWSKFENGAPVFLPGGKIGKGEFYTPPDLSDFV